MTPIIRLFSQVLLSLWVVSAYAADTVNHGVYRLQKVQSVDATPRERAVSG